MKTGSQKEIPRGISILSIFYAVNAALFAVTSLIFFDYLDIIILGKAAPFIAAVSVRLILIIIALFLAFGLYRLRKEAFFLAIIYQVFFIVNGLTTLTYLSNKYLNIKPFLEIVLKPEYKQTRAVDLLQTPFKAYAVQILGILVGIFIIIYLFKQKGKFKA